MTPSKLMIARVVPARFAYLPDDDSRNTACTEGVGIGRIARRALADARTRSSVMEEKVAVVVRVASSAPIHRSHAGSGEVARRLVVKGLEASMFRNLIDMIVHLIAAHRRSTTKPGVNWCFVPCRTRPVR